jgi:hypothetical protein
LLAEEIADDIADPEPLAGRQNVINAGRDLTLIVPEGRHASGGNHPLAIVPLLDKLINRTDRFGTRRAEEAAGIDDHNVGIARPFRRDHPALPQKRIHPVGIDAIFRTTERDDMKGTPRGNEINDHVSVHLAG